MFVFNTFCKVCAQNFNFSSSKLIWLLQQYRHLRLLLTPRYHNCSALGSFRIFFSSNMKQLYWWFDGIYFSFAVQLAVDKATGFWWYLPFGQWCKCLSFDLSDTFSCDYPENVTPSHLLWFPRALILEKIWGTGQCEGKVLQTQYENQSKWFVPQNL